MLTYSDASIQGCIYISLHINTYIHIKTYADASKGKGVETGLRERENTKRYLSDTHTHTHKDARRCASKGEGYIYIICI
jgi:hypothetical protein